MAKRGLELYYDLMSQPSRALYILFNIAKLPYTKKPVAIRKGIMHVLYSEKTLPYLTLF